MVTLLLQSRAIILLLAILILTPQLTYHVFVMGDDWVFHWNRFFEAGMQIKTGHFNLFQSLYGFQQSGRTINAIYGAPFAYIHGFALVLLKSAFKTQLLSNFFCLSVAGVGTYLLMRYSKIRKSISLSAALIYMSSFFVVYYVTAQTIRSIAAAFLPIAFIPLVRMLKRQTKQINPMWLGGSGALIFAIHNLTAFFYAACTLMCLFVSYAISKERKELIVHVLLSACVAFCLSAISLVAIYNIGIKNSIVSPQPVIDPNAYTMKFSIGVPDLTSFGLIISGLIVLQISFCIFYYSNMNVFEKSVNLIGFIFLLMASPIVPWNSIFSRFSFVKILQFPYRLAPIALLFILLGISTAANRHSGSAVNKSKLIETFLLAIAFLSTALAYNSIDSKIQPERPASTIIQNSFDASFAHSDHLDNKLFAVPAPDYLPAVTQLNFDSATSEYQKQVLKNPLQVNKSVNEQGKLLFSWDQIDAKKKVQLPAIIYDQSAVKLNGRMIKENQIRRTSIGALIVQGKKGHNSVEVGFRKTFLINLAEWVNLLAIVVAGESSITASFIGIKE